MPRRLSVQTPKINSKILRTDFHIMVDSTWENLPLSQAVVGSVIQKLYL